MVHIVTDPDGPWRIIAHAQSLSYVLRYELLFFEGGGGGVTFPQKNPVEQNLLKKISCKLAWGAMDKIEQVLSTNPVLCLIFFFQFVDSSSLVHTQTSNNLSFDPLRDFTHYFSGMRFGNPILLHLKCHKGC